MPELTSAEPNAFARFLRAARTLLGQSSGADRSGVLSGARSPVFRVQPGACHAFPHPPTFRSARRDPRLLGLFGGRRVRFCAHRPYAVQISLAYKQDTAGAAFSGKLSSALPACANRREVALNRFDAAGTPTRVATVTTDAQGAWSTLLTDASGNYNAAVARLVLRSRATRTPAPLRRRVLSPPPVRSPPTWTATGSRTPVTTAGPSPTPVRRTSTMTAPATPATPTVTATG